MISIERNVVFNPDDLLTEDDSVIVPDGVLNEGEQGKVIQNEMDQPDNKDVNIDEKLDIPTAEPAVNPQDHIPEVTSTPNQPPKRMRRAEILPEPEPNTGRGFRTRPEPGTYARMQGKTVPRANVALAEDEGDNLEQGGVSLGDDYGEYAFIASMGNEPTSLDEALSGPHAIEWQAAWDKEISRLEGARTWELVYPPEGVSIIPCNEVFKEKTDPDGTITERRYRIVAGGHKQKKGIDYNETFSSAAKMPTVRVMLADAAQRHLEIHQIDIKSAYLNAPLEELVYMHPPKRYLKQGQEGQAQADSNQIQTVTA